MRLFISYAHVDKAIVKDWVVNKLVSGGHDVWFDDRLVVGQDWQQQLSDEIERSDAFVYCMTPESVSSDWCQWELGRAVELGKPVVPVLLRAVSSLPDTLKKLQYVDFTNGPTGDAVARLMGGLLKLSLTEIPKPPLKPTGKPSRFESYEDQPRLLEAAVPACTKLNSETKLKLKLSLPGSPGLMAELPEVLPSGDIIQQGDVRFSNFQLQFAVDSETGKLLPVEICIRVETDAFEAQALAVDRGGCPLGHYHLLVPPEDDTRTVNFVLTPKVTQQPGLASIYIFLYQNDRLIANTYVETKLVNSMDDLPICGSWRIQMAMLRWSAGNVVSLPSKTPDKFSDEVKNEYVGEKLSRMIKMLRDDIWQFVGIVVTIVIALVTFSLGNVNQPLVELTPSTPRITAQQNMDIRNGPGTSFNRIAVLNVGNHLDILGISEDDRWYQVLLPDGNTGWVVAASSSGEVSGALGTLPVIITTDPSVKTPTVSTDLAPTQTEFAPTESIVETEALEVDLNSFNFTVFYQDQDSLVIRVNERSNLADLVLDTVKAEKNLVVSFANVLSSGGIVEAGTCLRYVREGASLDLPQGCSSITTFNHFLSDVFWYNDQNNEYQDIALLQSGVLIQVCLASEGYRSCTFEY